MARRILPSLSDAVQIRVEQALQARYGLDFPAMVEDLRDRPDPFR